MMRAMDSRYVVLLTAAAGAVAVFLLDLFTPPQVAAGTLYVLPFVALLWRGRKRDIYVTAILCAVLIAAGYVLSPAEQRMSHAMTNRLLQVGVVFVLALGMGRRIDARRELLRRHSRLKRLLNERNAALELLMTQHRHGDEEKVG